MTSADAADAKAPGMGHNQPPKTPFEIAEERCDLLHLEATNWFDGDPIANEGQASAIKKLLADVREAENDAEAARKVEAKPFNEGKAKVQARYETMLGRGKKPGRFDMIKDICKKVLTPWLVKVQAEIDAAAEQARKDAEEAAAKAQKAFAEADQTNLEAREEAERYADDAQALNKHAKHAAKDKAVAKGGQRAVTLRTNYEPEISNYTEFARHVWQHHRTDMQEFLDEYARRLVRAGERNIPGITVNEKKVAV